MQICIHNYEMGGPAVFIQMVTIKSRLAHQSRSQRGRPAFAIGSSADYGIGIGDRRGLAPGQVIAPAGQVVIDLIRSAGAINGYAKFSIGFDGSLLTGCEFQAYAHLSPSAKIHARRIKDAGNHHPAMQVGYPLQAGFAYVLVGYSCDLCGSYGHEPLGAIYVSQGHQDLHHPAESLALIAPVNFFFLARQVHGFSSGLLVLILSRNSRLDQPVERMARPRQDIQVPHCLGNENIGQCCCRKDEVAVLDRPVKQIVARR